MNLELDRGAFGPMLRRMRLAAQLSQEELAERARLSVESISALERGRRRAPYRETIVMLADALRLSEDQRRELAAAAKRAKSKTATTIAYDSLATIEGPSLPVPARDGQLHHLPDPRTPLIGRETELAQLQAVSESTRLLTIVGAGGTGKTRLVVELARILYESTKIDTHFIDLAPLRDVSLTVGAMSAALGIILPTYDTGVDAITRTIGSAPMLLIVDNCEHVIDEAGRIIREIITACPGVRVIATSREALQIDGETAFRLASLSVPPEDAPVSAAQAAAFGAVALFVERARACNSALQLSDATLPDIGRICRRLDGIPLAIELAAARTASLSVPDLLRTLNATFTILTDGRRGLLPRQQTLRALIDWSYDLLSEPEKLLLRRLSVFAGGWTLEAVQTVCTNASASDDVAPTLFSLVAKSLVVADTQEVRTRYRLLESTRVYAREKLAAAELQELERRHATWVVGFATSAYDSLWETPHQDWMRRVAPELANIRLALQTTLGTATDVLRGAQIVTCVYNVWYESGQQAEGRRWVETALERIDPAGEPKLHGRLWWTLALFSAGKAVISACRKAIEYFTITAEPWDLSNAYFFLAMGFWQAGQLAEALEATDASIEFASQCRANQRTLRIAQTLDMRGNILAGSRAYDAGRSALSEAYELFKLLGDERGMGQARANLAELESACGFPDRALELLDEAALIFGRLGANSRLAALRANRAAYHLALNDIDRARHDALEALSLALRAQEAPVVAIALQHLASVLGRTGKPANAALLIGYVNAWFSREGYEREPNDRQLYERLRELLEEQLPPPALRNAMDRGQMLTEAQIAEAARRFTAGTDSFS